MPYKKTGSRFWWITYQDPTTGRRISESARTTDRLVAARLELDRRQASERERREGPRWTFDDVAHAALTEHYPRHSATTRERAWFALNRLYDEFHGLGIDEIGPAEITRYKRLRANPPPREDGDQVDPATGRKRRPLKPATDATIRKELLVLSAAIRYVNGAYGANLPNPVAGRLPPKPERNPRWLTLPEYRSLMEAAGELPRAASYLPDFIVLGVNTGMRSGELLRLEWDRVDLGQRLIYLAPEDQKSRRVGSVPINDTALAVLRRRFEARVGPTVLELVTRPKDAPPVARPILSIKKAFSAAVRKAGIGRCRPHDLRHTFASWLVQSGVSMRTVAELLRHTEIETAMIYAHLAPQDARDGASALDRLHRTPARKRRLKAVKR